MSTPKSNISVDLGALVRFLSYKITIFARTDPGIWKAIFEFALVTTSRYLFQAVLRVVLWNDGCFISLQLDSWRKYVYLLFGF